MHGTTTLAGVVILMTGCLAAPEQGEDEGSPPGDGEGEHRGGDEPDEPVPAGILPTCQTKLHLAFVTRFEAPAADDGPVEGLFEGIALFVNAGDQALDLSDASIEVISISDPNASAAIDLDEPTSSLPAGEAHGLLQPGVDDVVLVQVPEPWSSSESPGLSIELDHNLAGGNYVVDLEARAGALLFPMRIVVEVVPTPPDSENGRDFAAVESLRVAGICAVPPG